MLTAVRSVSCSGPMRGQCRLRARSRRRRRRGRRRRGRRRGRRLLPGSVAARPGRGVCLKEGRHFSRGRGCTRDARGKAGPFSVERLKADLLSANAVRAATCRPSLVSRAGADSAPGSRSYRRSADKCPLTSVRARGPQEARGGGRGVESRLFHLSAPGRAGPCPRP